jgi:hypothetical protein
MSIHNAAYVDCTCFNSAWPCAACELRWAFIDLTDAISALRRMAEHYYDATGDYTPFSLTGVMSGISRRLERAASPLTGQDAG